MALSDNLVAYWSLDEASGNAIDAHDDNDLTETSGTIAATTGKVSGCRDFEAGDTEYFAIAHNADLSTGDINFTFAAWVNPESLVTFPIILGKGWGTSDVGAQYAMFYDTDAGKFAFGVAFNTTSSLLVRSFEFGGGSAGNWYFVVGWHDADNNQIGISVNAVTADLEAHSAGVHSGGTELFSIGASVPQALYWDGLIDEVGFWKRVLTSEERTELYNSGNGRDYAYIISSGTKPSNRVRSNRLASARFGTRMAA
jgi:hypothetical protein